MFSKRNVTKQVEKLELEQGDIIVLRVNNAFQKWVKVMTELVQRIKKTKNIVVTALVLPTDLRFGKVSEKEMNNVGWFRQDKDEMERIIDENAMLREWNENIKKLHVEESLKSHDVILELKEKLKEYEHGQDDIRN